MKEKQIGFKTRNGIEIVQLSEIIYCIADGSYTIIVTKEKSLIVTKSLSKVENFCHCRQLFRSHKSYLVNKKYISKIQQNKVLLRNCPDFALISRRKLKTINNVLNIRILKAIS